MESVVRSTRISRRGFLRGAAATAGAAALAGLSGHGIAGAHEASPASGTPQLSGKITLYNGQHESTTAPIVEAFEKATGIEVEVRNGESDQFANQIKEEGSRSPADVFYSEEAAPMNFLTEQGLLATVPDNVLSQIPTRYNGKDGAWVGISARARVVVYDPEQITEAELPASIFDFTSDFWKGKVGFVPTSGAFREQIAAIIALEGKDRAKEWLEGLKRNGKVYRRNGDVLDAVERGQIASGLINHYYWFGEAAEVGADKMHSKLYYIGNHDPGALVNVSPAGILKSTKKPELAAALLNFMVSEEGQKVLATVSTEYPLRPGVHSTAPLKPLDELEQAKITAAEIGDGQDALELEQDLDLL
jgi:iron(III) transport system substrate-binding protein